MVDSRQHWPRSRPVCAGQLAIAWPIERTKKSWPTPNSNAFGSSSVRIRKRWRTEWTWFELHTHWLNVELCWRHTWCMALNDFLWLCSLFDRYSTSIYLFYRCLVNNLWMMMLRIRWCWMMIVMTLLQHHCNIADIQNYIHFIILCNVHI